MMRIITWLLLLIILIGAVLFHMKNDYDVELSYYFIDTIQVSFSLLFSLTLLIGSTLGVLASLPTIYKLKRENVKLKSQVKQSEKEITNLRVLPLKDS